MSEDKIDRRAILGGVLLSTLSVVGCEKKAPKEEVIKAETGDEKSAQTSNDLSQSSASDASSQELENKLPTIDPSTLPDTVLVRMTTEYGTMEFALFPRKAPLTVANFLLYVETKKLDNAPFYRAMESEGGGFVQAMATGFKFPPIPHESTKKTGLSHTNGALSMARYGVGTATNEFTISIGDMSYMDAGSGATDDNQGYAVFGRVTSGMGVARKILKGKRATKTGAGEWAGQTLKPNIMILKTEWLKD